MPINPFTQNSEVINCKNNPDNPCAAIKTGQQGGWCYDATIEKFWANSNFAGECAY